MKTSYTMLAVADALFDLLQTKDYQSVTVHELCRRAGICKRTFYNHFKDIYDLREQAAGDIFLTVRDEVLPENKAEIIQGLQEKGEKVFMVGDGINDAPALVQADVGAAIGGGSSVAIESADIILMKEGIKDVPGAIKLSRLTIRNIKENLFWAFFYNTIMIPLAAGVLIPKFNISLNPMMAGAAMALSSICVVGNALRLRTKKLNK